MKRFQAVCGSGPDWLSACNACIGKLANRSPAANLGFVYTSDSIAHGLDLIAARLREATGIAHWVGTGGSGVCTSGREVSGDGTIAILTASLPEDDFRVFDGLARHDNGNHSLSGDWRGGHIGVIHGDPRQVRTPAIIERLGAATGAFLVGGLTSAMGNGALQIADRPTEGALSGVLITGNVPVITGISQGCTPIGPVREVTAAEGPWIATIDDRPALDVLKEDVGPILARNLHRIAGFILAARPQDTHDRNDYLVRDLDSIDPLRRLIMVSDDLKRGDPLCFVKRDPQGARADLRRLTADLRRRAENRPILGALYHSCVARSRHMFETDSTELFLIEEELGNVPLAGFLTNGEIYRDRLYGYSGVLTLFLG